MRPATPSILTINGGSSSIRFAVYEVGETPRRRLDGKIDRIGLSGTKSDRQRSGAENRRPAPLAAADHRAAAGFLLDWLEAQPVFASVKAAGHRVVHGMQHSQPERVTPELLAELRRISPYDPEHLPARDRADRGVPRRHPDAAPGGVLRHRVSPHHAAGRQAAADSAALRGEGRRALRLPRPVLRLSDGGTRPPRSRGGEGPRDPRASRQRRQPGRRARRQEHRHQHGLHADGRIGDEHPHGRPGSRPGLLPGAHRADDARRNFSGW